MIESIFNKLQMKLVHDESLSLVHSAIMTADVINNYDEMIKKAILDWADGKDVDSFSVGEIAVSDLKEELNCTSFQALCILNSLQIDPDTFDDAFFVEWEDTIL